MTRKTGQRRGGAVKRGGEAFLCSQNGSSGKKAVSTTIKQEFPGRNSLYITIKDGFFLPGDDYFL